MVSMQMFFCMAMGNITVNFVGKRDLPDIKALARHPVLILFFFSAGLIIKGLGYTALKAQRECD